MNSTILMYFCSGTQKSKDRNDLKLRNDSSYMHYFLCQQPGNEVKQSSKS